MTAVVQQQPTTTSAPHPKVFNVGASTTTDGNRWQLLVTPGLGTFRIQSPGTASADTPYALDPTKPIIELDQIDATILVVIVPGDLAGHDVQATVSGTAMPSVTLTQPQPDAPAFAIIAATETGPISIHLLNATGQPGDELRNDPPPETTPRMMEPWMAAPTFSPSAAPRVIATVHP